MRALGIAIVLAVLSCAVNQASAQPHPRIRMAVEGPPIVVGASGTKYEIIFRTIDTFPTFKNEKYYVVHYKVQSLDDLPKLRAQAEDLRGALQSEASKAQIKNLAIMATIRTSYGLANFDKHWGALFVLGEDGTWRYREKSPNK